jgi:hypothetical protein
VQNDGERCMYLAKESRCRPCNEVTPWLNMPLTLDPDSSSRSLIVVRGVLRFMVHTLNT